MGVMDILEESKEQLKLSKSIFVKKKLCTATQRSGTAVLTADDMYEFQFNC